MIGRLQWATTVITAGRPFIRRLIDLTLGIKKPHYYIRVSKEAKKDIRVCLQFFAQHNGKTFFRLRHAESSATLNLYTDASGFAAGACVE